MGEHIEIIAATLLFDFRNIIIMKRGRERQREREEASRKNIENKHVSVFGNGIFYANASTRIAAQNFR